uniref:Secreted protein n=1 Tax=Parastrongyloides trichosuri TaxID=131310 RepID=A0A0N5A0Z7_PARTI
MVALSREERSQWTSPIMWRSPFHWALLLAVRIDDLARCRVCRLRASYRLELRGRNDRCVATGRRFFHGLRIGRLRHRRGACFGRAWDISTGPSTPDKVSRMSATGREAKFASV